MSKKEIFLVGVLIAFGIFTSFFETDIDFSSQSGKRDKFQLLYKDSPNTYIQEEKTISEVNDIRINNQAGDIILKKSPSTDCIIVPIVRIFHREKIEADQILEQIRINFQKSDKIAEITVDSKGKFPFQYARVILTVLIPQKSHCQISNAHGEIFASEMDVSFSVENNFGSTTLMGIPHPVKIRIVHNKSVILKDLPSIKLSSHYSKIKLMNIPEQIDITESSHSAIVAQQCGNFNINGQHSKLILKKIRGDINISNSHAPITLENILGDIRINARNCPISISKIDSEYMMVKNRFRDLLVEDLSCDDLDILITHGNLFLDFEKISGMINIKNTHSDITLNYPTSVDPSFNIHSYQGRIFNNTALELDIIKKEHQHSIQKYSGTPEIIINNTYGDITFQQSK